MTKKRLFAMAFLITACALSVVNYVNRAKSVVPELVRLTDEVFLTSQLSPESMRSLRTRRIKTIVDIRPDGEAKDQASSSEMEIASKRNRMGFHYIPVPHESIPDDAVEALNGVLSHDALPAVIYCRTGRRAVRTFALAEASQSDGPGVDAIMEMIRAAGFSADDLRDNIVERIAHRTGTQGAGQ